MRTIRAGGWRAVTAGQKCRGRCRHTIKEGDLVFIDLVRDGVAEFVVHVDCLRVALADVDTPEVPNLEAPQLPAGPPMDVDGERVMVALQGVPRLDTRRHGDYRSRARRRALARVAAAHPDEFGVAWDQEIIAIANSVSA